MGRSRDPGWSPGSPSPPSGRRTTARSRIAAATRPAPFRRFPSPGRRN